MTSPLSSAHHPGAYSTHNYPTHNSGETFEDATAQNYAANLGRRVKTFVVRVQSTLNNPKTSGWRSISGFFTSLYDRTVRAVNYISLHADQMIPEYLTKAGACCVGGFIIGAVTPVGPLWGTVTGLLLATGWQLCVEYHTDRSRSPRPHFQN